MKTIISKLLYLPVIILSLSFIFGCGGSSQPSNANDKTSSGTNNTAASEENTEESIRHVSDGDIFHVGDSFLIGDMKVVYVCSGDYYSDNQFIQPKEGNKYIYLKLYCENVGNSDDSLSSFDFECYADGYSMDSIYLDNSLSASLSAGRSTEGFLYFEIPQTAQEVEIEHSISLFGNSKFSLIYEGELYSDFEAETNASVSDNVYMVGQTAEGDLAITYLSCYSFTSNNEFIQPKEGFRYITFEFEVENTSSTDQSISSFSFQCYADGVKCDGCYIRDDELSATLSPGRKAAGTISFEVPVNASVIETEYEDNVWTSSKIIFLFSE